MKIAIEPAHEATFHARSYGFRPGRSAHDAQKVIFLNLKSNSNGSTKRILELDIEKCFDRIALAQRGLKVKEAKTKLVKSTEGFDFLGWHFQVQSNGKFRSYPSEENYRNFIKKVKTIVNCSNYGAKLKAKKLAPIIRGWRNYHKYCLMSNHNLWHTNHQTFKVFLKEKKINRYEAEKLVKSAFPTVSYSENKFANVQGKSSPYDGNLTYWSERNSKLYDGPTAKALKKQDHKCGHCNLKFNDNERVHLHHIDHNHGNWKSSNLLALH
jgi:hypothetical protein